MNLKARNKYLPTLSDFFDSIWLADWATIVYSTFTAVVLLFFWCQSESPWDILLTRLGIVAVVFLFLYIYTVWPNKWTRILRIAFPLAMLGVWYPDTFEFARHLPNLDHVFATADLKLFGCEPAYEMSRWLDGVVWSELFNAGYFAYYLMIALGALVPLIWRDEETLRTLFIVVAGFYAYYIIYLFLPVAGPQFYFAVIDPSLIAHGPFPALGDFFNQNPDCAVIGNTTEGFFQSLVAAAQEGGERPVAAFPSSHVGMSTILMFLFWRLKRGVFFTMLPLYLLLCGATVYIGAHYLIDVFAGWCTAIIFFYVLDKLYIKLAPRYEKNNPL